MNIISNENMPGKRNWMHTCLLQEAQNTNVDIAVAFFSDTQDKLLKKMVDNGCSVRMVVRLNYGTNPDALIDALKLKNVNIRFFTSTHFHPKFYLVGNRKAYIGSANFTDSGLHRNQELVMEIDEEDMDFGELHEVFERYWNAANVLDDSIARKFRKIMTDNPKGGREDATVFLKKEIGIADYNNAGRDRPRTSDWSYFSEEFRRIYQLYLVAFGTLKRIYSDYGKLRYPGELPLRIEIDRFLWWVREYKAKGDSYRNVKKITDEKQLINRITPLIDEFVVANVKYLDNGAIEDYLILENKLGSPQIIESLNYDGLYETLWRVHAFRDQVRHCPGGTDAFREQFMQTNAESDVKKTVIHLLFDGGDYIRRIYDCYNNPEYKLKKFGEACTEELYGNLNKDDIPTRNGRTQKSLQFLGFGIV